MNSVLFEFCIALHFFFIYTYSTTPTSTYISISCFYFYSYFCVYRAAAFAFRITIYFNKEVIFASIFDWTVCVFKNFNGSDAGWQDVCGVAPRERPSYTFNMFILTFIAGQGIIITLIFKGSQIFDSIKKTVTLTRQLSKRKIYATAVSTSHTAIPINFESTVKIMDRMERDSPEISVRMNPEQQDFFRKKSILDRESRSQNYRT